MLFHARRRVSFYPIVSRTDTHQAMRFMRSIDALRRLLYAVLIVTLTLLGTGCDWGDGNTANGWVTPDQMYERALTFEELGVQYWARSWYHKAAEAGHPIAQVKLGFLYRYGRVDLLDDPYETHRWFLRVAQGRAPIVLAEFGIRYEEGPDETVRDPHEAERWFRRAVASCQAAAVQGDLEAQTLLGGLYGAGVGVEQDRAIAMQLWQDAAQRGYAPAQLVLGRLYWHEKAYEEARPWLMKAAMQNLPEAEYLLSDLYQFGRGVEPDHEEALQWLRRAAEHGYEIAQRQLRGMETLGLLD